MEIRRRHSSYLLFFAPAALLRALQEPERPPKEDEPKRLPDGRLQTEAIAKEEHKKSLEDVNRLIQLAEEIKKDLEKNQGFVVSLASVKKTEEVEKLAKRLRSRMMHN